MKTAIKQAIDIIEERLNTLSIAQRTESVKGAIAGYQYSRYLLMEFLEKEKEQIIEAFEQGIEFGFPTNGSNYFNKTYNQNK